MHCLLFEPLFCGSDILVEDLIVLGVLQVLLEAMRKLEYPSPLRLHRSHMGFDRFTRRMVLEYERLSSLLNCAKLYLAFLEFTHQILKNDV